VLVGSGVSILYKIENRDVPIQSGVAFNTAQIVIMLYVLIVCDNDGRHYIKSKTDKCFTLHKY